jgi:hypothetical protein
MHYLLPYRGDFTQVEYQLSHEKGEIERGGKKETKIEREPQTN